MPDVESDRFTFAIECDWSSRHDRYMLFVSKNGGKQLLDFGSKMQSSASSFFLGELYALVWACKRTKAFSGMLPVVVRTDDQSNVDEWRSKGLL